jgi:hypothetical protein
VRDDLLRMSFHTAFVYGLKNVCSTSRERRQTVIAGYFHVTCFFTSPGATPMHIMLRTNSIGCISTLEVGKEAEAAVVRLFSGHDWCGFPERGEMKRPQVCAY